MFWLSFCLVKMNCTRATNEKIKFEIGQFTCRCLYLTGVALDIASSFKMNRNLLLTVFCVLVLFNITVDAITDDLLGSSMSFSPKFHGAIANTLSNVLATDENQNVNGMPNQKDILNEVRPYEQPNLLTPFKQTETY